MTLLGTQRYAPTLVHPVRREEVNGRMALVTCGWQEREDEEEDDIREHVGLETVNLRLYARANQVMVEDPELAEGHRKRQQVLRHKQDFYRIRLTHELEANHVIRQRRAPEEVMAAERDASIASIQALDAYHQQQCRQVNEAFEDEYGTHGRAAVVKHREELRAILDSCDALAIAGGHVASMLNRLRLFGLDELLDHQAVFAWAAGAMVVTDRVVLFHDNPPQGRGASELLDSGLGMVPGVVAFPHAETRLELGNHSRIGVLARRFGPSMCLALPAGAFVTWKQGALDGPCGATRLHADGRVEPWGPPLPSADERGDESGDVDEATS